MTIQKQYTEKVVNTIIHFMAMAGASILSKDEAEKMFDEIPEDLQSTVISALMAAREAKKLSMMTKLASIFPLEEN